MDCEKTDDVDVPLAYVGLRILLVVQDTTLSHMPTILGNYSFKVTAILQATLALSILQKDIDQFDLVMVDADMLEMNYLEFIKFSQLIKEKPIVVMAAEVTMEMLVEAKAQGVVYIFRKSLMSLMKLKSVWKHVDYWHRKKAYETLHPNKVKEVVVMGDPSRAKKQQDRKGKSKVNCSEIHQNQVAGSKRTISTNEEARLKIGGTSEKEKNHSLLSKRTEERPAKRRRQLRWTPELDEKLDEVVRELGEKAPTRQILERMCMPDMTTKQLTYRIKKKKSEKQQAQNVQIAASTNFNEEHHPEELNSSEPNMNVSELFQGTDIPQPPDVPLVAMQSSDDFFLPQPPDVPLVAMQSSDDFSLPQSLDVPLVAMQSSDDFSLPQPPDVPLVAMQSSDDFSLPQPPDVPLVAMLSSDDFSLPQPPDVPLVAMLSSDDFFLPQPPDVPLVAMQSSDDFSLPQDFFLPQPPDVPLVALQSSDDFSLPQPPDVPLVAVQSSDDFFLPQPPDVPLVAMQSSDDCSLSWWNEWDDDLLELDDFEPK